LNYAIFNHFTSKYGSNRLNEERCDRSSDVHVNYFHRRLAFDVELSSTSQASRRSMPGTDYVSAMNVHMCRSVVSGRAGGYAPGMTAAYENQASTSQASRRSMPRTDYVSAINVHICRSVVQGPAGGYAPGMSAAYETRAY